jgi:murein DD-endopeptidase MepM/ murein hydrolase activator NlpD
MKLFTHFLKLSSFIGLMVLIVACATPTPNAELETPVPNITRIPVIATANPTPATPTPTVITVYDRYTVRSGDTLGAISARLNLSIDELMRANNITNPNTLAANQVLKIPILVTRVAFSDALIPDSEMVYSPAYAAFDINAFVSQYPNGYLAAFSDKVEGEMLTGAQILQLVAERYSVGPRVLLALLEYEGGWLTKSMLTDNQIKYPMGNVDPSRTGLFYQASWAANRLNEGYYGRITGRLAAYKYKNNTRARIASNINPGTAGIQNVLALITSWEEWQNQVGANGWIATYRSLFGDPKQYAIDPLIPSNLKQPTWRLPFPDSEMWYYTGGPHGGWGDLTAWSAIDFSPRDMLGSCNASRMWAVASAAGKVIRSEHGRVVVSLSGNDFPGTGWTLMYLHMATSGRAAAGTLVNAGDRIGHPSCEGGTADSSHLHFARLYNGQWMGAEMFPFVLSGWTVNAADLEYEGTMSRNGEWREACNCREDAKNGVVGEPGK